MTKKEFMDLLENAEVDEKGNLYYRDGNLDIGNKVYFATVTTICDDFVDEYCYETPTGYEHYNRHFTPNDDTFEVLLVKEK